MPEFMILELNHLLEMSFIGWVESSEPTGSGRAERWVPKAPPTLQNTNSFHCEWFANYLFPFGLLFGGQHLQSFIAGFLLKHLLLLKVLGRFPRAKFPSVGPPLLCDCPQLYFLLIGNSEHCDCRPIRAERYQRILLQINLIESPQLLGLELYFP